MKTPESARPKFIASGGNDDDISWSGTLSREIKPNMMDAISFHYYTVPTGVWEKKGAATGLVKMNGFPP